MANPYVLPRRTAADRTARWDSPGTPPRLYLLVAAAFAVVAIPLFALVLDRGAGGSPHPLHGGGTGLTWQPSLAWVHVGGDLLTGGAYVAISSMLIRLARKAGRGIPFLWALVAFGTFIIACGLGHVAAAFSTWEPIQWVAGGIKYATAAVSVATAVALPPLVPRITALVESARIADQQRVRLASAYRGLAEAEARFRGAFDDAPIGMALVAPDGHWLHVNRALCEIVGYDEEELLERTFQDLTHPADLETDLALAQELLNGKRRTYQLEKRYIRKDGRTVWVLLSASLVRDEDGAPRYFVGQIQDVNERKALEEQLRRLARRDPLTGLPNRADFVERLEHALDGSGGQGGQAGQGDQVSVLFLDLDGFKRVNDGLGHEAGDRLLVDVGRRIQASIREGDVAARLGGDEFTVLLRHGTGSEGADRVADRLVAAFAAPFSVGGEELTVTSSIGLATGEPGGVTAVELLRRADIALYKAKGGGKACHASFDHTSGDLATRRLGLEADLRRAVELGGLRLDYQPEVDLDTGRIVGFEALVRWDHPRMGLLYPSDFLPLAEESGLVVPLGWWVVGEACRQATTWLVPDGDDPPLVAVNLSAQQLRQPDVVQRVARTLAESGLPPSRLELEIAETALVGDPVAAGRALRGLRRVGVRLAIDDFGTGSSSLHFLGDLTAGGRTVDTLKVDRSFVAGVEHGDTRLAIIEAVVSLARALEIEVTAEGIETAEERSQIRRAGCVRGQGFHFAPPLPARDVPAALLARLDRARAAKISA